MSFSVAKVRPFRSLGLYRSSGKHAAPRGSAPLTSRQGADGEAHRPAHAAMSREGGAAHEKTQAPRDKEAGQKAA
jgi:hypothetical protein